MTYDSKDYDDEQAFDVPGDEKDAVESDESFSTYEDVDSAATSSTSGIETDEVDENVENVYYAILIGLILFFLYIVYKIYGYLLPVEQKEIVAVQKPQITAPAPAPIVKPIAPPVAPKPVVQTIVQSKGLSEEEKQKISQIASSVRDNNTKLSDLLKDNDYMVRESNKLKKEIEILNNKVGLLTNKLDTFMENQVKKQQKPVAKKKQVVVPLYEVHIRAMTDGRAWVVDRKGHTKTLVAGSSVKDYGKVEKIMVNQGVVTTTSGRVITFKKD
tara:strand:- start:632 stop:1447 length:816 start_codon:yes stop_codon:yes gene_type:complete